ncbi:MAG: tRNA (adenosine(37)-N6)-dimethylallyltransferase MiaA [bacterium]|nr:tRNA (adenosine(37)-N6)-dimethylallyltransferase MiaA [bacterium]
MPLPKILVILGPTASGKSALAVELAQKYNGEIISADSRQVYKGLDIGTGKITKGEMQGIPHHLLDVADPKKVFTVQDFKTKAEKAIAKILKKKKVPIICGGTGFYIQSIVDNIILPEVKPNTRLRSKLKSKTPEELFAILLELDHQRAATIDPSNPHRLIRAIEIATKLGKVPPIQSDPKYESLQIGIQTDDELIKQKIHKRLIDRLDQGMIEEVEKLHKKGLIWKRLDDLGLEYRYIALFLQNKIIPRQGSGQVKQEMIEQLEMEIWHYAKRQKTWFKRDQRIKWFALEQKKEIGREVSIFLKNL